MFVKLNRSIILSLLVLSLLVIIPMGFAADNSTAVLSHEGANETQVVSVPFDENTLTASNDYYFNASAESDGDGSISSPYKYLKADRIKANSNLYFANGEYNLDKSKSIEEVKIIGSDAKKTVIKYDGVAFTVNNQFTVKNITFIGLSISNRAKFNATNVIFEDGYGSKPDSYGNNYGGAICTDSDYAGDDSYVYVDNCTFKNNYAIYGGAIYMGIGTLTVKDSLFLDNLAYNYGGAIACEYIGNVSISNSRFYNSCSLADAGGSIYIRDSSKFTAGYVDVVNSSSTFGGAITTLYTDVSLNHVNLINNSAQYDGGAIYHMYGDFSVSYSIFNNNSASNGGAIFIDNSTNAIFMRNTFTNNRANGTGGAIYSILNNLNAPFRKYNSFSSNSAAYENDCYDTLQLNLMIGDGNYTMYRIDVKPADSIPSRYSLVEDGYVTTVKDQEAGGNCWAFTALSVLESCVLKATGEKLDISEENMKNIIALYSDYGWKIDANGGGYDEMSWGYLASWMGPVNEIDDLYDDKSALSPILKSIMHIQNIKFLNRSSYTDNDEIKRAILEYGAVAAGIYYDSYYLNGYSNAYYCWYTNAANHEVTIVGWDDAYSKTNFRYGSSIEGDGAWIVKNSWGSSWGDDGYFYVSYYDANFARPNAEGPYTIILNDTIRFDRNYQYDIGGKTDYFINSSSKVWYKNKFTSTSDEYLAAISTYFEKTTNWTATVLVNDKIMDVLSGISTAGYYTLNLNKFIPIKTGDVFEIIINITTSEEAGVPISEIYSLNKLVYSPENSYISYDGENWADLYNLTWEYSSHTYYSSAACIKAFTFLNPINTLTDLSIDFNPDGLLNITATVLDEFGNPVKYGNVTFNVNGENQTVEVIKGMATLSYELNRKVNSIFALFSGVGYNSSSNKTYYTVPKINITWQLNITQALNNVNITVDASKPLNESIVMNINGENIPFELINGSNVLELKDLSNDFYSVHVSLKDDSDYSADVLSGEFVIELYHTKILSNDLTATDEGVFSYNITLMDENDNLIAGKEIVFTVGNVTYANKTGDAGEAVIFIKLDKGVYGVNSTFKGDNGYFPSNASNVINVKGKVWINMDINVYSNNAFINIYASNLINETFTVFVNNETYDVYSQDGVACLKLLNLANDIYNVTVSLNESEYEFNKVKSQFVIYIDDNVEINSTVVMSGDDAVVSIEIGNVTDNANVIVDGESNFVHLINGHANYTITNIAPGNHSIVIIYKANFKSDVFTVPKKESSVELTFNNSKTGERFTIVAEVTTEATGLVSIDINGTSYLVNLTQTNKLDLVLNEAGEYSIVATYLGDDRFNSSTSNYTLVVSDKKSSNISIEVPEIVKIGDEVSIRIVSEGDANLTATVNGEVQGLIFENDNPQLRINYFNYTPLKEGIYNVTVTAEENSDYKAETVTRIFEATKKDAVLEIAPITDVKVGDNITISVYNETDGELTVKVNGESVTGEYEIVSPGLYTITAESAATDIYNAGFATYTFHVEEEPKEEPQINISTPDSVQVGNDTCVNVSIPGATGNVTVIVDGNEVSVVLDENGTVSVPILNVSSGNHGVVVIYSGDDRHNGGYNSTEFSVFEVPVKPKEDSQINISTPEGVRAGNDTCVNVSISGAAGNVTVIVDGNEVSVVLDENGTVSVPIENISSGNHSIVVIYSGDDRHNGGYNSTVFNVSEEPTPEPENNITVIIDGREYPTVVIDGKAVVTLDPEDNNVTVVVNGVEYNGTVVDGRVMIEIPVVEPDANVTVIVDGQEYECIVVNGTVTIQTNKTEPKKASEFSEITIGDNQIISIVLKDEDGNVISNAEIRYSVSGVLNTTTTDNGGRFTIAGENDALIVVRYDGNEYILATNMTLKLNSPVVPAVVKVASHFDIENRAITINGYAVDTDAGEVGMYYATTLLDADGKPISNKYIEFAVNNKIYKRTTYENGSFEPYKLNMIRAGRYTMAFNFAGDDNYTNAFACVCVDLDKKPIKIKANDKSYKASSKTKKYTVTLSTIVGSSHDGKVHLKSGLTVYLTVNGKTYSGKTDDDGQVTFKMTNLSKKGKYTAKIYYKGDKTYEEAEKSVKLTIK